MLDLSLDIIDTLFETRLIMIEASHTSKFMCTATVLGCNGLLGKDQVFLSG